MTIVRRLGKLGIDAADVSVVIHELVMENWGIRGGRPADEVDLGYGLDVEPAHAARRRRARRVS